jgi:hypothetical protein
MGCPKDWDALGVKLTPSHRLYGLGAILLVALTICSRNFSRPGSPSFLTPLAVAGVAYTVTWAGHKKAGPLLISTDHRGTADGKPGRVFFSNVSVKLAGSDTWVNAQ